MAATDAKPFPQKNVAYRVTFPILDADGDPVPTATGLDSEVSKDGGTFTDCGSEATEIAAASGIYYLDLTAAEMNADTVAVQVKTTFSGAKTTIIVMYPEEQGDIRVNVTAWAGTAVTTLMNAIKTALAKGTDITGFNDLSAAQVNAEVDSALDTAIPGTPTANSVNERIKTMDDADMPTSLATLLSRVSATIFTGITSLKEWLGLIAGKQVGNATARTELRSTGAGSGTFDEVTDSIEAIRDRGDIGWITGGAGDPWSQALPGAYAAGQAGYILGNRLDATVSSRATPAQVQTELGIYGALKPTVPARTLDVNANGEAGVDLDNTSGTLAKGADITGFNDLSGANVQSELVTYGALKPTVAGRALDVSAAGEAGLDWANIGTPASVQVLSGTTIGTTTNLTNDPPGVTTLLSRITATLFTGITSLSQWLGMIAGKQVGNTTARTEIRATGAGSGTFDEVTDSVEAIRDRGDAAWITGATPAQIQTELNTYGALKPTTAGRTLDVSVGGEAGLDWANIGTPGSTQNLSDTTIKTVTNLTNDPPGVTTLLSRITSTLFTGITSLKEWLGLLAGKQSGNTTARTEIRSSGAGSGTYDETTDSQEAIRDRGDSGWITGSPADPWLTTLPGVYGAGTAGKIVGDNINATVSSRATQTSVDAIATNVTTLLSRITATLFSGITSLSQWLGMIAGKQTGNVTARTELRATGAGSGTFDETTDSLEASRDNVGNAGAGLTNVGDVRLANLDATVSSRASQTSVNTIDGRLDTEIPAILSKVNALPTDPADASDIAAAFVTVNGKLDAINGSVDSEVGAIKLVTDKLDTALELDGAVYRYTVNALENAPVGGGGGTNWTAGEKNQIRHRLGIDGTATAPAVAPSLASQVSLDSVHTKLGTPQNLGGGASIAQNLSDIEGQTDDIGVNGAGLTNIGDARVANLDATVSSRATPAQVLTSVNSALNAAIPASPTADSINERIKTMDDANMPAAIAAVDSKTVAIKGKTDALPPDPADASDIAAQFVTINGKLDTANGSDAAIKAVTDKLNTALEPDGPVYRYTINALEQAPVGGGGAGDPWNTVLPGAYPNGSAGKILGDNLDAKVSSRATQSSMDILLGRIGTTLFSGITSLAEWLGLMAGKQTANVTARSEIQATGAGSGTYNETTDSLEAIRERGDVAWIGGGNGSGPSPTPDSPCAQNPAQTRGPTTEPPLLAQTLVRKGNIN